MSIHFRAVITAYVCLLVACLPAVFTLRSCWGWGGVLGYLRQGADNMLLSRNLRGFDESLSFCQHQMEQLEELQNSDSGEKQRKFEKWLLATHKGQFAGILPDSSEFLKKIDTLLSRLGDCPQDFKDTKTEVQVLVSGFCEEYISELRRIQDPQHGEVWRKLEDWKLHIQTGFMASTLMNVKQFSQDFEDLMDALRYCPADFKAAHDMDIERLKITKAKVHAVEELAQANLKLAKVSGTSHFLELNHGSGLASKL